MATQNPFEELLDQFKSLLKFIEEHMDVPVDQLKVPEDIDKRLKRLQKRVDAFNRLGEDVVALSGVSKEELQMRLQGLSEEVPPEGKQLINKSQELKQQAEALKGKIEQRLKFAPKSEMVVEAPTQEIKERELSDSEKAKKRKGKFKRFGSNDKWKPL